MKAPTRPVVRDGFFHRKDAKSAKVAKKSIQFAFPLRSLRPLRLCGENFFAECKTIDESSACP
jgi:hypothetical protein